MQILRLGLNDGMFYLLSYKPKGIMLQKQKDTHTHMHTSLNYLKDSQVVKWLQQMQFYLCAAS